MSTSSVEPGVARCQCLLAGGRRIIVDAQASPDWSRIISPVKVKQGQWSASFVDAAKQCNIEAKDAYANHQRALQMAISSARIHERLEEVHFQVEHKVSVVDSAVLVSAENTARLPNELSMLAAEFCAVVADRASRGLMSYGDDQWIVLGQCTDWITGHIHALPAPWHEASLRQLLCQANLGPVTIVLPEPPDQVCEDLYDAIEAQHPQARVRQVQSLASFSGQVTATATLRRQSAHFPILSYSVREPDTLLELEVVVRKLYPGEAPAVHIAGLPPDGHGTRQRIIQVLDAVRAKDPHGQRWYTLVRMPNKNVQQHSYELALAVADRIARGREFSGPRRVLATGAIAAGVVSDSDGGAIYPRGKVLHVEGVERKQRLIEREAKEDDTVLLPANWQGQVNFSFARIPAGKQPQIVYVNSVVPLG